MKPSLSKMSGSLFGTDSPWTCCTPLSWVSSEVCFETLDSHFSITNPTGNQPWIFTGRTDAEAWILWVPVVKSQLTGKDPDAGKDGRQAEKRMRWLDVITDWIDRSLSKFRRRWRAGNPACWHSVAKSPTGLSDVTKTHFTILAWEIPWTQEPGRLQSLGISKRSDWALRPFYISLWF